MSRAKKVKVKKGKPPKGGGALEAGMFTPLRNARDNTANRVNFVLDVTDVGLETFGQKKLRRS